MKTVAWTSAIALTIAMATPVIPAQPAFAAQAIAHYRIDPASHIGFHVEQVSGGAINGSIPVASGHFEINAQDLAHSSVTIELSPGGVATGQPRIDAFLRSNAVFDTQTYPAITFTSTNVVPTGPKSATITGALTARGKSRPETFQAAFSKENGNRMSFHVTGDIPRLPYGMGVGVPIYSNVVSFDMQLEGVRE
ncbi:hypothetical protein BJF93_13470 [Xaviernesmea oryzae]|uniref:Lipid/polyisoprenoid-binding YceI-like domain-containing protein n=1 Tax=Xaviernesmea oryzae TaxID=464029 RepID=A0A1Q9AQY9_9HYPH|nr:YceI family protein [Xaviernesmea oryzae]OLP57853.1 hypothetical protein BJF93_13470 [Xaviernesmea oryzae]SEL34047.1 Polyisoprenoid-binding protein YceI [Xaviernesmea oryzae]